MTVREGLGLDPQTIVLACIAASGGWLAYRSTMDKNKNEVQQQVVAERRVDAQSFNEYLVKEVEYWRAEAKEQAGRAQHWQELADGFKRELDHSQRVGAQAVEAVVPARENIE